MSKKKTPAAPKAKTPAAPKEKAPEAPKVKAEKLPSEISFKKKVEITVPPHATHIIPAGTKFKLNEDGKTYGSIKLDFENLTAEQVKEVE